MSRLSDRARHGALLIVASIVAIGALGGCDKLDGRNRNRSGSRLFRDSNFVGAVGEYEKAVSEVDEPTIHYNLALAYSKVFRPGYDKPVRLDAEGSLACQLIPGVKLGKADVCVKEGDTKYTDCTDLELPAASKDYLDNPVTKKIGEALAKSDVATALAEVRLVEKNRTADGQGKDQKKLEELLDKAQSLIAGVCPSSYTCKSTNLCSLESPGLADLAAKHYQIWLAANPTDEDTRKQLTQLWLDSNQFDKAIGYWEDRLKQKPEDVEVMGVLAGINLKAGNWRKSIEWFTKVADLAKDDNSKVAAYTFIGNVAWQKLSSKTLDADATVELADRGAGALGKVISIAPNSPKAFGLMGAIYNFRAMASGSSIAWNLDRATARDLQLNSCVLNDEAKKANCSCKVLQVGCPPPPPTAPTPPTPPKGPAEAPTPDKKPGG